MTLVDAMIEAASMAGAAVEASRHVSQGLGALGQTLSGPGLTVDFRSVAALRPDFRSELRPDFRAQMFRASPAELALGILSASDPRRTTFRATEAELALGFLRPNDPRRRIFRATAAEQSISWRDMIRVGGMVRSIGAT